MATVYLARDLKHDRPVALKVLLPELAATLGPDRFQREIKLAARLQHPHILTVHDSGETAGQLWFTMPYVEGESLRDRLRRERQLPLDDALRIAREAAQALQYAHEHGVVHRDIKPENLLLTKDGNTLVADFGIARALGGEEHLTQTGMSVGTPAYMSPEQASGDKALDARTDVYSLGAVLYEMLAGEPPYTGPTAQQIIMKRFTDPVPSVRKARPSVPESVDQAIQRSLAPLAADRFGTVVEFGRALQIAPGSVTPAVTMPAGTPLPTPPTTTAPPTSTVPSIARARKLPVTAIALGLGFLIGAGMLFAWRRTHAGSAETSGPKVLAVLPFENLGDSADAYFADGVTEEVRGKLSRITGLEVIARGSSNQYRHTTKPPQEIAHELGADYLLTATVRWEKSGGGSRVRVTTELADVGPGHAPRTRWQEPFDASLTDVFQVQADIAAKVASALDVALGDSVRRNLAARPTANLTAYDAFLKGEAASQGMAVADPASLRRAADLYEQAVALDSGFVAAWAQLARARSYLYGNWIPTPELATQARLAAERAQSLGPDQPEGYLALSEFYRNVSRDNARSLAAAKAGLVLAHNNADLLTSAAVTEQRMGNADAALQHIAKASEIDPRSPGTARRLGITLLYLRRYPEALAAFNRGLTIAPGNLSILENKVAVVLAQGDSVGARTAVREAARLVDPVALLTFFGNFGDLYWVLDDAQQRQLLTLPVSAFDEDRATWAIVLAQTWHLRGNQEMTRAYADSARLSIEDQLRAAPDDPQRTVFHGLAQALRGRKAEAIADGRRAVALWPISQDAYFGAYIQHQLVRIYLLVGEPEQALDNLEPLLRMPYVLSAGWLRVDPNFASLRSNPRFERLAAGK